MLSLIHAHGLPIVALMVFIAELGLPTGISPKVALVLVGSTVIGSIPALATGLVVVTVANLTGSMLLHLATRFGGMKLAARILRRNEERRAGLLQRCHSRLGGHDAATVLVLRLIPLVRIYATVATALSEMPLRNFVIGTTPAALIWSGTPLALGFWFRDDANALTDRVPFVSVASIVILPVAGLIIVLVRRMRSRLQPIGQVASIGD